MSADSLRAREIEELRQIQEFEKQQAATSEAKRVEDQAKTKKDDGDAPRALIVPKGMKKAAEEEAKKKIEEERANRGSEEEKNE